MPDQEIPQNAPTAPPVGPGAAPVPRRIDLADLQERALRRAESIRERKEWIEARRRELFARIDRQRAMQDELARRAPAMPPREPVRGVRELPPRITVEPGVPGPRPELRLVGDEWELERRWLRGEVAALIGEGWGWAELEDIGLTRALLGDLGFDPAAQADPAG